MSAPAVTALDALATYRVLRTIRTFEERVAVEYATGDIPGAVHLYLGQEAVAAGVVGALRDDDYVSSTHRGHGHAIAKGCDPAGMMHEIFGTAEGLCRGKGGSMHIADFDRGMLGANGIAAGGVPLACGAALTSAMLGQERVAVAFVGDGGANQGAFAESLNLAAVWQLPVVFVVEDNGYAQSTGTPHHLRGIDVAERAAGFGMPGVSVDGTDVRAVHAAAAEAVERARSGGGPTLVNARALRWSAHMEGWDKQGYRDPSEVDNLMASGDCIARLVADAGLDRAACRAVDREVAELVDAAVVAARAAARPDVSELETDVRAPARPDIDGGTR